MIKQAIWLLLLAAVLGLAVNLVSPNRVAYIGTYRELSSGEGPIVPPTAEPGDPPFIDLNQARFEFDNTDAVFIDARDPYEVACGTIPGSINIPFDYLPAGDLAPYMDSALGGAAMDRRLITYCSGEECDLSLHLGRNLAELGYTDVAIFFGGAREWEKAGFEMERTEECE